MFEAFAIRVLHSCSSVKQTAPLLQLDGDTVQGIMKRGVERGLERRETKQITQIGIDEKSGLHLSPALRKTLHLHRLFLADSISLSI